MPVIDVPDNGGQAEALRNLAGSLWREISPDGTLAGLADLEVASLVRVFTDMRRLFADDTLEVFRGDIVLFTATADKPAGSPYTPELWRAYVTGDIDVHPVDCVHGAMTQPEPLTLIGSILNERLRRAFAPRPTERAER